jgi:hypothetical protein
MIELPNKKIPATRINPKKLILFSKPKVGKTEMLSALDNCLLIDLENGSEFVDSMKVNILKIASEQDILPIKALKEVIAKIKKSNEENGGFTYKYGAIDTVTALEDHVLVLANKLYLDTPQGRNWQGDDVTALPNGAGR